MGDQTPPWKLLDEDKNVSSKVQKRLREQYTDDQELCNASEEELKARGLSKTQARNVRICLNRVSRVDQPYTVLIIACDRTSTRRGRRSGTRHDNGRSEGKQHHSRRTLMNTSRSIHSMSATILRSITVRSTIRPRILRLNPWLTKPART